jgi:16S rRNA (guanine966-N2)-methyltransferase
MAQKITPTPTNLKPTNPRVRITSGTLGGRVLRLPSNNTTRPTMDRVRLSLFNMLATAPWAQKPNGSNILADAQVLDAFAGTGVLGFEALSRGAAHATFCEADKNICTSLHQNIAALGLNSQCKLLHGLAQNLPTARQPYDIIFLDPPYDAGLLPTTMAHLHQAGYALPHTLWVVETAKTASLADVPLSLEILTERPFGASKIWVARVKG